MVFDEERERVIVPYRGFVEVRWDLFMPIGID
jgi:hypothetical protein